MLATTSCRLFTFGFTYASFPKKCTIYRSSIATGQRIVPCEKLRLVLVAFLKSDKKTHCMVFFFDPQPSSSFSRIRAPCAQSEPVIPKCDLLTVEEFHRKESVSKNVGFMLRFSQQSQGSEVGGTLLVLSHGSHYSGPASRRATVRNLSACIIP
jgi:hypothetical protein